MFQISFFVIQLLIFSLLFYTLWSTIKPSLQPLNATTYFIILSGVVIYFAFQYFLNYLLATLFNLQKIYKKIIFEKINYLNAISLLVLPPLLFVIYTQNNYNFYLWITILISAILLITRYLLVLKNNKTLFFKNLFYFILYLCALELAPLVIILKLTI